MCSHHWSMLSISLQNQIYAAYRPGQCNDKRPSKHWMGLALKARAVVAHKEGRIDLEQYGKRLEYIKRQWFEGEI